MPTTLKIDSHVLTLTHTDKLLFPDDAITKGEFIDYYRWIADIMVPHLQGRPVNMFRFHDSIQSGGYYQQQIPASAPYWVNRVTVRKEGGTVTHIVCNNAATLVYLANQDCITPHIWLSRTEKLESPDQMIFDLDPAEDDFGKVRQGARFLKSILDEIGLKPYLKTTGSRGLHVVVPLEPEEVFESVGAFAQKVAAIMTSREPGKYTTEQRKEKGKGFFLSIPSATLTGIRRWLPMPFALSKALRWRRQLVGRKSRIKA